MIWFCVLPAQSGPSEAAYRAMWANARANKQPHSFLTVLDHHIG